MGYREDVMSDMLGEDWEKWICPIKGPAGMDLCYEDRNSEECRKCEEEFMRGIEEQERRRRGAGGGNGTKNTP